MKKLSGFLILACIVFSFILPVKAQDITYSSHSDNFEYANGRVLKVISETQNKILQESLGGNQTAQLVKVKILNGKYKGKIVNITNQLTSNPAYDIPVSQGRRVILDIDNSGKLSDVFISDIDRIPALLIITGLFFALFLLLGGVKGLKALLSLLITSFLLFFVLVPAILDNIPPIPVTIAISIIATVLITLIICGANLKSLSAIVGIIVSVALSGILALLAIKITPLTGYTSQEAIMLYTTRPDLNFTGLLASAMIIGALGAIIDIGITISSSIYEINRTDKNLSSKELIKSGLNIGRDIMGAMSNTLILAYIGGALPLILLAADAPLIKLINLNSITAEIMAALVGSIGIILCVPTTAVIAGLLMGNKKRNIIISENIQDIAQETL